MCLPRCSPPKRSSGARVNPTVYTPADWRKKRKGGNAFVVKVAARPKLFLSAREEDLG